jgi:hypothetical protein
MNDGDLLIFTIPNMEVMLKNNYTNCINFEHTVYFTEPYIEYFWHKYGFELVEKQYFKKITVYFIAPKKQLSTTYNLQDELYEKIQIYISKIYYISH